MPDASQTPGVIIESMMVGECERPVCSPGLRITARATAYNEMKLVALIKVVSPTNKAAGPGRVSYQAKQGETLARDCHLIEIDLLRNGRHVLCVPEWRVAFLRPFDFLCCVNRWPVRNRYELYPRSLRERLPR